MFKKLIASLITMSFLLGVAGCGKKQAQNTPEGKPKVRVAFWGAVEEKQIITKTIEEWQKKNPEIDIVLQHIPGSYTDKVLTEIAGGNPPDIIFSDVDIFVTFYDKGALLDLTPYIQKDKDFSSKIKDYFPEVLNRFTRDGKIWCIPRDVAPFGVIFYNKTLFKKENVPLPKDDWDMKEFLATATKLTLDDKGLRPDQPGFNPKKLKRYGYWGWSVHNFIYSFGGRFVDNVENPTKCVMNQQAAIDGMQFFLDLSYKYYVSPQSGALVNMGMSINQLFSMEKLAMFQAGIWETPNMRRLIGDRFEWDVVMSPKGPNGQRGFGTGGSGYCIMKTTKFPDAAWEVLKCLAGEEGQTMLAESGLAQPANRKIAEGPAWAGSTKPPLNKKMLNEAVKYCVYNPFHVKWREMWDRDIYPQMDLMINQRITVKEGFDKIAEKIDPVLSGAKK